MAADLTVNESTSAPRAPGEFRPSDGSGNSAVASRYLKQIEALASLGFNYDAAIYSSSADKVGWNVDHYSALLGSERPGEIEVGGPFAAVKEALALYSFPNPRLISAVFDPNAALAGRNMLMFAKFLGFTFTFGVRIVAVVDERRKNDDGSSSQVWGYAYRTLQGHFEVGEIRFEVSKNLKTGDIGFTIDAYSKPDRIPNFFYRLGFRLFGRSLQRYFAHSSIRRLQLIVKKAVLGAARFRELT